MYDVKEGAPGVPSFEKLLPAYLAEYNSLRQEQLARLGFQTQCFNFLLVVLGFSVSAVAGSIGKPDFSGILLAALLFLPIVTAPLGFVFFDNEMAIHSFGSHIANVWKPEMHRLAGETNVFGDALAFRYLNRVSPRIHRRLSVARWLLFLFPTVLPVLSVLALFLSNPGWWQTYVSTLVPQQRGLVFAGLATIYVIDLGVSGLLLSAIYWTFVKYKNLSEKPPT